MRFLTHGDKSKKSILLIHGMANTSDLFAALLSYLKDYYVIVCELDGHSAKEQGTFLALVNKMWLQLRIFAIIFAAGAVILLMSVHILFWIDILKESLGKCRNE